MVSVVAYHDSLYAFNFAVLPPYRKRVRRPSGKWCGAPMRSMSCLLYSMKEYYGS